MPLTPDQRQQLDILGYTSPESRVRIRAFVAKGTPLEEQAQRGAAWRKNENTIIPLPIEGWLYPNKGQGVFVRLKKKRSPGGKSEKDDAGKAIWIESRTYQDGIGYLNSINAKGYGIYLIPNEGGGEDVGILRFPALFYECDEISKEEQWQRLRSLEAKLGQPASLVIETRKSLHCYLALEDDKLLPSTWTQYQQRLIQEQDSDPAIWNPARLMRLAGFKHQKWNEGTQTLEQTPIRLVQSTHDKFKVEELERVLPPWDESRWRSTKEQERIITNPSDNPWDMRNIAQYLEGYDENGRPEWATCKCPVHNGESNDSLQINKDSGGYHCWKGCDPKEIKRVALEIAEQQGYSTPKKSFNFAGLFGLGAKFAKYLSNFKDRIPWKLGRKGEVEVEEFAPAREDIFEYDPGDRLRVWQLSQQEGYNHILDTSATGTGKSFDAGQMQPEKFGVRQALYVSAEHRNPSTPTLKAWADLEARHKGLARDKHGKLRRADKGQPWIVPPNCGRVATIGALRNKNIEGADTSELVCQTCPHFEPCAAGATFDYLNARGKTLAQPRVRAHQDSLPDPDEYDYSDTVVIWEEAGEILKPQRTIKVENADVCRTIADISLSHPDLAPQLMPLLAILHQYICGEVEQPDKFGWDDRAVRAALPDVGDLDLERIATALKPNARPLLNTTEEYDVDLADLPRSERKHFSGSDEGTADKINSQLALNWLPAFLTILLGHESGSFRIANGVLNIATKNERYARIARAAKCNVYLDATASATEIARALDIVDVDQIAKVRQSSTPCSNVDIVQVATVGRLGNSKRSNFSQSRIDAIIAKIQASSDGEVAVIDFKRHVEKDSGRRSWWTDSRGINDLESCSTLIAVGTPCPNLADLEAEFQVLHGRSPEPGREKIRFPIQVKRLNGEKFQPYFELEGSKDREFREFVHRKILASFHQAIGRLRAQRRPGEQLRVFVVADYPLDFPVTVRKASDFTPDAATKTEKVELAIRGAVKALKDQGKKITQGAIAELTGYSQQHISRFRDLLKLLLNSNSKMSNPQPPPPDQFEAVWMSREYLPLLTQEPPTEMLSGLLGMCEVYGDMTFKELFEAAPGQCQVDLLSWLLLALPFHDFRTLTKAMEP